MDKDACWRECCCESDNFYLDVDIFSIVDRPLVTLSLLIVFI